MLYRFDDREPLTDQELKYHLRRLSRLVYYLSSFVALIAAIGTSFFVYQSLEVFHANADVLSAGLLLTVLFVFSALRYGTFRDE